MPHPVLAVEKGVPLLWQLVHWNPNFVNEHSSNHDQIWCAVLVSISKVCRSCHIGHCLRQGSVIYFVCVLV